ncbi:hypothetical protein BDW67DRAFT_160455 [Aspergillus spinulosporus]
MGWTRTQTANPRVTRQEPILHRTSILGYIDCINLLANQILGLYGMFVLFGNP